MEDIFRPSTLFRKHAIYAISRNLPPTSSGHRNLFSKATAVESFFLICFASRCFPLFTATCSLLFAEKTSNDLRSVRGRRFSFFNPTLDFVLYNPNAVHDSRSPAHPFAWHATICSICPFWMLSSKQVRYRPIEAIV